MKTKKSPRSFASIFKKDNEEMTIREYIVKKRKECGITQQELSEKTKIPQSRISEFESGKRAMDSDNIDKIFKSLNIHFHLKKQELWEFAKECANTLKSKGIKPENITSISRPKLAELTEKEEIIALRRYSDKFYDQLSNTGAIHNPDNTFNYVHTLIRVHLALITSND